MVTPEQIDLSEWLQALGLGSHAEAFRKNDITFDVLRALSDTDLKELGLSLGHRRLLLDALHPDHALPHGNDRDAAEASQGERRQITVLFCDLVGSTPLSQRLDLDDLRSVVDGYYKSCGSIIKEADGFMARLVGDGILAYFGYPKAREDAAECAVRASLRILDQLRHQRFEGDSRLDVHIGLATGVTVISDMVGTGFAERHAATGLTPNLAARIQGLATAGTVLVSDDTRRLAGGMFTYADMGLQQFRGMEHPVRVWQVTGESLSTVRFEAHHTKLFEFVGREAELGGILDAWALARHGQAGIVTVRGEAGIGKSRLVRTAVSRAESSGGLVALLQCSPHQASTPLHPLVSWIRRDAGLGGAGHAEDLQRLANWLAGSATPVELMLVAELVGVRVPEAHPSMLPDRKRQLIRDVLARRFQQQCESAPVLFILEDAHWMDGATEDFLRSLFRAMRDKRFLALVTARPPDQREWSDAGQVTDIRLDALPPQDAERLIRHVCRGEPLPPALVTLILARTDGVPLFIEELTSMVLESGLPDAERGSALQDAPTDAASIDIPLTLRDSLMARLDRLEGAKAVARVASALGREFSFSLLSRVSSHSAERLAATLDRLVDAQLVSRRGDGVQAEFAFKHALIQQAAYEGQLRTERQALHARIVRAIELYQPETAAREPGLMAHHCREAGLPEKEAVYLYEAGLLSTRIVAVTEALSYFSRAQDVIAGLEQTPRNVRRHIDIILGMMEVGRFAILPKRLMELGAKARVLASVAGVACDDATMSSILFQEARALLYSSRYSEARRIFSDMRQLGRERRSALIEMKPASALTMTLCCQGLFNESLEFMNEQNIDRYKEAGSVIDYIAGLGWIAYALCETGPGDGGLRFADLSVREAEQLQSPIYVAGARIWRSHALMAARRIEEAVEEARQCVELSEIHSVPYLGWHGLVFLALCLCRSRRFDAALESLARARRLLAGSAEGQWSLLDYLPAIEAEIACFRSDHALALAAADEAIERAQAVGGFFAEAIAWRAKAVCSIRTGGDPSTAQVLFDKACALHEAGGARAEQAFATLTWAHELHLAGHAGRARPFALAARDLARARRFSLGRCEYGASAML